MPMRIINQGASAFKIAGYLSKRGPWTLLWNVRYFVLTPKALVYFKKHPKQMFGEQRGKILLNQIIAITRRKDLSTFELRTYSRRFYLQAQDARVYCSVPSPICTPYAIFFTLCQECEIWMQAIQDSQQRLREGENALSHSYETDVEMSLEGSVPDTPSQYSTQTLPHLLQDNFQLSNHLLSRKHLMISPAISQHQGLLNTPSRANMSKATSNYIDRTPSDETPSRALFATPRSNLTGLLLKKRGSGSVSTAQQLPLNRGMTSILKNKKTSLEQMGLKERMQPMFPPPASTAPLFAARSSSSKSPLTMQSSHDRRKEIRNSSQAMFGSSSVPVARPLTPSSALADSAPSKKHPLLLIDTKLSTKRMLARSPSSPSVFQSSKTSKSLKPSVPERVTNADSLSRTSPHSRLGSESEFDLVCSDTSDTDIESDDSGSSSDASDSWLASTKGTHQHTLESFPGSPDGEFWVQAKQKNMNKTTFKASLAVPLVVGTLDSDSTILVLDHQGWEVACIPTRLMFIEKAFGEINLSERVQVTWRCKAGISNLTYPQLIVKVAKKVCIFMMIFCTLALLCMLQEAQQKLEEVVNEPATLGVVLLRVVVSGISFLNSINILRVVLPRSFLTNSTFFYGLLATIGAGMLSFMALFRFLPRLQSFRVHELTFSILATETKHHSLKATGFSKQQKRASRDTGETHASLSSTNFSSSPRGQIFSSSSTLGSPLKSGRKVQPWGRWAEADPGLIRVKKNDTKVPAGPYMYALKDVFLFHLEYQLFNVATRLKTPFLNLSASSKLPFLIINFQFLGPKWLAQTSKAGDPRDGAKSERYYNLVAFFQHQTDNPENPVNRLLQRFVAGSDEFRNQRVKIVPRFPYDRTSLVRTVIQKAVMSRTLSQTMFTDTSRSYIEVDIDVSGSKIARKLTRLVSGHSTSLVLDLSLVFESHKFEPECFLGGVRLVKPDLTKVLHFQRFQPMPTEPSDSAEINILHLHQQDRAQVHHQPWGLWSEAPPDRSLSQAIMNRPRAPGSANSSFLYRLAQVETGSTEYKLFHASSSPSSFTWQYKSQRKAFMMKKRNSPVGANGAFSSPLFVVHLQLPGARKDIYNHITCYFVRDIGKRESPHQIAVFDRMVDRFLDAPDHFRNTIFKIAAVMPSDRKKPMRRAKRLFDGSHVKKQYFQDRDNSYVEIDIDVRPSKFTRRFLKKLNVGHGMKFDLMIALEGIFPDESSEYMLGGVSLDRVNFIRQETVELMRTRGSSSSFRPIQPDQATADELDANNEGPNNYEAFDEMPEESQERCLAARMARVDFLRALEAPNFRPQRWGHWSVSDYSCLQLRGKTYLKDKVKIPASENLYVLAHHDMISTLKEDLFHVSTRPESYAMKGQAIREAYKRAAYPNNPGARFGPGTMIVVNFLTPIFNVVCYFERNPKELLQTLDSAEERAAVRAFDILLDRFLNGTDAFRTSRFKFIPRVIEGNWVVKRSVGTTPAILGNKLTQTYYHDPLKTYLEIDVDVGSSKVGGGILGMVKGAAKSLTIDLSFLLEGQSEEELPERLIGGVRLHKPNLSKLDAWASSPNPPSGQERRYSI